MTSGRERHIPDAIEPSLGWHVWGQEQAVRRLQMAIRTAPVHAYLFAGPASFGKRLAALNFAMALCCVSPPAPGVFCGECSPCRRIARGVFPDVTIHDLATQAERDRDKSRNLTLNVATVREVSAAVAYRPSEARWRIVIIDDVETMQETAQEAFLKTLEEPPAYAVIVMLTTDAESLLETIRSRCALIRFGRASRSAITGALLARGHGREDADAIASLAGGSVGWALRATRDPTLVEQRAAAVNEAITMVGASAYERLIRAVQLADAYAGAREATRQRLHEVQEVWRAVLYAQLGLSDDSTDHSSQRGLAELRTLPLDRVVGALKSVDTCLASLEANVRPRLALEAMVGSWPEVAGDPARISRNISLESNNSKESQIR